MQRKYALFLPVWLSISLLLSSCQHEPWISDNPPGGNPPASACSPDTVYYNTTIRPLLVSHCGKPGCHDAITSENNMNLGSYTSLISSGIINVSDPANSSIWIAINNPDIFERMPPAGHTPLSQEQKDRLFTWMEQGAKNNTCDADCSGDSTYSGFVKPLLELKCIGCHSGTQPQGGLALTSYPAVKNIADNGSLIGTLTGTGYVQMPLGMALPACEILAVQKWMDAGAPEN